MRRSDLDSTADKDPAAELKRLRLAALRALMRKEHGLSELQRKLEQKGFGADQVRQVLAGLQSQGMINDNRYAESFVRQHAARGQGPIRIRAELRTHGLDAEAIEAALQQAEVDWGQQAREVRRKRFGPNPPRAATERAKQSRFLQYRGFDSDQIRVAFRGLTSPDDPAFEGSEAQGEY